MKHCLIDHSTANKIIINTRLNDQYECAKQSYQGGSLYMGQVLQQAFSVVDGGVQFRIGVLPLAIQVFST